VTLQRLHLATALVEAEGHVLLVASRYPNQPLPLWGLPGGRQRDGELLMMTAIRELTEETGLSGRYVELAYVSESFDTAGEMHVLNTTFRFSVDRRPSDGLELDLGRDAHVTEVAWVPREMVGDRIAVSVVREPLVAHLADPASRYYGFAEAGISIAFADEA